MKNNMAKQMTACLLAAGMAAQPAYAAVTDISNVPLGAAAGSGFLPNLLFILDDSGSMASDYNPDYVNDGNACMTTSGGSTTCQRGDPPFEAGGANGFNGVGYDPNFTYLPGLSPNGQPFINPPSGTLTTTAVTPDAYLGDVMGDLSGRRGHIVGTEKDGRLTKVKALVPEAELDRYATTLHSITHGRGTYRQKFHAYEQVPPEAAQRVVEARKKEQEEAKA